MQKSITLDNEMIKSIKLKTVGEHIIRVLIPKEEYIIDSAGKVVYCFYNLYFNDKKVAQRAISTEMNAFLFLDDKKKLIALAITNEGTHNECRVFSSNVFNFKIAFPQLKYVISCHNHPKIKDLLYNDLDFSGRDVTCYKALSVELKNENIVVLDDIVLPYSKKEEKAKSNKYGYIYFNKIKDLYNMKFKEIYNVYKRSNLIDPDLLGALVLYGGDPIWEKYKKS